MKEKILQTLKNLREYALTKNCEVVLYFHEEDSYLMRFANSAISSTQTNISSDLRSPPTMIKDAPATA